MAKYTDLTDMYFGKLHVIERDCSKNGNVYWKCKCECGNIVSVRTGNLTKHITKSCGCYRTEKLIERSVSENEFITVGDTTYMYDTIGNECIIDTEDLERVKVTYWSLVSNYWVSQRNKTKVKLHRFLMGFPKNKDVDHKDGNTSFNKKCNLRVCSHHQNSCNHKVASNNTTGVTGVTFVKRTNKYMARIKHNQKEIFLGNFDTLEEATKVRKEAEKKYFKEYRRLN